MSASLEGLQDRFQGSLETTSKRRKRRDSGTGWYVTYEFEIDGSVHKNENMLDMGRGFNSLKKGDVIGIVYDSRDPKTSRAHIAAP